MTLDASLCEIIDEQIWQETILIDGFSVFFPSLKALIKAETQSYSGTFYHLNEMSNHCGKWYLNTWKEKQKQISGCYLVSVSNETLLGVFISRADFLCFTNKPSHSQCMAWEQ